MAGALSSGTGTRPTRQIFQHNLGLLSLLIRRELKVKYRGSFLGYLWSMLNPLFFMVIISFVFSKMMRGTENYDAYVLAGILFWNMTAQSIIGGTGALVGNAGLLLKVRTPMWIFAIVPLGSAMTNLILALVPYLIFIVVKGISIPVEILLLPIFLLAYSIFLAGISLALSTANVFFRDVAHVMEPIMQLLFYATPIIYDRHNPGIPNHIRDLLGLNPFARFVELFREVVYNPGAVDWAVIASLGGVCVLSLTVGLTIFYKMRDRVAFKI
jgi:ABC-type polysaccharide/polyol phosphate export permease